MSKHTPGPDASAAVPGPAASGGGVPAQADEDPVTVLWRRYRAVREHADRERLILHYTPLVSSVAGRVGAGLPSNVEVGDCESYGMFGLIEAVERFDPDRGVRFEPYAMSRIRGAILDGLRALDWIPRSVRAKARALQRAYAALEVRLHRAPTEPELAAELGLDLDELAQTFGQLSVLNLLALDELLSATENRPGGVSLGETLADLAADDPVAVVESQETRRLLRDALGALPERERRVIELYYVKGRTLAQIGEVVGVSESRVCQLHAKAVLTLRSRLAGGAG